EEYDFKIIFVRRTGRDGVNQILAHGGKDFVWQMGGWENTIFGLSEVDGKRADENPTSTRREKCLENGRVYTSVVEVRKDRVTAILNAQKFVDWKTDYRDLDMNDDWRLSSKTIAGVGTWGSLTEFRSIELRPVSGRGRALWPKK